MRRRQAVRSLLAAVRRAGRTTGWDAAPPTGTVLGDLARQGESCRAVLHRLVISGWDRGEPVLNPAGIVEIAKRIRIVDQEKVQDVLWCPYEEQLIVWERLCACLWVYVLKGRQVGVTLATLLFDLLWTSVRDSLGSRVKTALLWHTDSKAEDQVETCEYLVAQIGLPLRRKPTRQRIVFPNGSRIEALSATSKGVSRGLSYQRYHCSEVPFWGWATRIWGALLPSLNLGATLTIETTMEVAADPLASDLWRDDNRFGPSPEEGNVQGGKVFLPLEMHRSYRADPALIPDEKWEWLQKDHGFTDRGSGAWLWAKLSGEYNHDEHAAFREYPQLMRHAFEIAEGRYIKVEPRVVVPVETQLFESRDGTRRFTLEVFRRPEETSQQIAIGFDTAGGNGGDRSALVVVDKEDRAVCATLASEWIDPDDFARVGAVVWEQYNTEMSYHRTEFRWTWLPQFIVCDVETNGKLGKQVAVELARLGVPVRAYKTGSEESGTREQTLHEARRWIEGLACFGPKLLADECGMLFRKQTADGKDGGWFGHDDLLMALGMALRRVKREPYVEEIAPVTAAQAEARYYAELMEADESPRRKRTL